VSGGAVRVVVEVFDAPPGPAMAAWARQVPTLLHRRLALVPGIRPRLWLEGNGSGNGHGHAGGGEPAARLRGRVEAGPFGIAPPVPARNGTRERSTVHLDVLLTRGTNGHERLLLSRSLRFPAGELLPRLAGLAVEVSAALGVDVAGAAGAGEPAARAASAVAIRDYLRAIDLTDDEGEPLEAMDRRSKLDLLLLAVEADASFEPARDALLEAALRAHEKGLRREATKALNLLARLAPGDPRAPYVLGELAFQDDRWDEAAAFFRRCLARAPEHVGAHQRLGVLAWWDGDRDAARDHLRAAARFDEIVAADGSAACAVDGGGNGGAEPRGEVDGASLEALFLLGVLFAEEGETALARAAFARVAALDPEGRRGPASIAARRQLRRLLAP
jgi:Flp pilus assembly protein TadD